MQCPTSRRLLLPLATTFLLLLLSGTEARRNTHSRRRQAGKPRRYTQTQATAPHYSSHVPFLVNPDKNAILSKPLQLSDKFVWPVEVIKGREREQGGANMEMDDSILSLDYHHPHLPSAISSSASLKDTGDGDDINTDNNNDNPDTPYDGDDETTDSMLAISLLGLCLWIGLSALIVTAFIQQEKRRELMLKFWHAIDQNPSLRAAVEREAGGIAFPKMPRHAGLHRFLRAMAVALAVTVGLNIVLFAARPPGSEMDGSGDDSGGAGENGGGSGGGDVPMDPTSDDGSMNPLLGVVFVMLFVASLVLIARGLHAACCASRNNFSASSSSNGGNSSNNNNTTASSYPGNSQANGGTYEPVPTVTPYVSMPHPHTPTPTHTNTHPAYSVGVPVASAPPQGEGGRAQGQDDEEGAPPPYSAALAAVV